MEFKNLCLCTLLLATAINLAACSSDSSAESTSNTTSTQKNNDTKSETNEDANDTSLDEDEEYADDDEELYTTEDILEEMLPDLTDDTLELATESYMFISDHPNWFPATSKKSISAVKKAEDHSVTVQHLNKNVSPYYEKILSFSGVVVSIEEDDDGSLTIAHVIDDEDNSYQFFMFGTSGDILENDYVRIWGIPLGPLSFENVSGGTTNVQVIFGTMIEKI
ncbi:hypothetical protein [Kurthia massiliensis]|uniref:hypothetical protein n=1 Tax=Kurthia massiliensis TaxID=1033739 RepID=UPI000288A2DF|nr:hypothetical protein [Kurthia massiliensis]